MWLFLPVQVKVVDGGVLESRRHLNVRGKSATLPAITDKDWLDLKFGVEAGVDYFALSFVKVTCSKIQWSTIISGLAPGFHSCGSTVPLHTCSSLADSVC